MAKEWTADGITQVSRLYQPAAVLAAAADLDLYAALAAGPPSPT